MFRVVLRKKVVKPFKRKPYSPAEKEMNCRNIPSPCAGSCCYGNTLLFLLCLSIAIWLLVLGKSTVMASPETFKGPLKTRNQFPAFMMFINPIPASAVPLGEKEIRLSPAIDYSSVYVNQDSGNWEVLMDMELTVIDMMMAYGITKNLTLSFQPVFVHMSDGFMDNFLESYHDRLGVSNDGRENRPQDAFGYFISYDNQNWVTGKKEGLHPIDSLITAKYGLLRSSRTIPVDLSVAYNLKIPLGDPEYGFGSGEWDHGIHFLSRIHFDPVALYLNGGYNFLSDPETNGANIRVDDTISLFAGLEYGYSPDLSVIIQMNYVSSPFQDVEFSRFEAGGPALDMGFVYRVSRSTDVEFSFGEDLAAGSVPDFTFHLRVSHSLP